MTGTTGESHLGHIWQDHLALGPTTLSSVAIRILSLSHSFSTLGQMVKVPTFMGILLSVWVQENSFNLLGDFFSPYKSNLHPGNP